MTNKRLYNNVRWTADILFVLVLLPLIILLVERALAGAWTTALIVVAVAAGTAIARILNGPFVGPALVEVTNTEPVWKSFFYIPTKTQRKQLSSIKEIRIAGPKGDRRFRTIHKDGSEEEFRPFYGRRLESRVIDFLRQSLPERIAISEAEPPTLMALLRDDF
ncbi:hypothetical protein IC757_16365 [Wenzhouxiangella sp. AB-CW3]|uniref:hypothetical protein n=1 Tax=Wenzhouxiangella sp. AB-CW3 TaxID=2771012 RepID=UPI00168B1857|nr:hypothetical protein [Wenzhouxiangella sp. AB-CW3]QOC22556.1 hypothetical protein IC757_16365 [Wenzhouxiangella sp. AB-CW3]